jgi:acetate kinase
MKTLVINTGSSSIKYQLLSMPEGSVLCSGLLERIGEKKGRIIHKTVEGENEKEYIFDEFIPDHEFGMKEVASLLSDDKIGVIKDVQEVELVGHRIVHGGDRFHTITLINDKVKEAILELSNLAPLHNPANLVGINTAEKVFPHATQVGVFDTAFHQSIPETAFRYALPEKFYKENAIRAYGFHGTSHRYVSRIAAEFLNKKPEDTSLITLHLGNGASVCAVKNGKSIDTSLGMTTITGLVMGTRIGDIDPGVLIYMQEILGLKYEDVKRILTKESGLLGLCGDNDLRNIVARYEGGDEQAILALSIYAYRIKKYIGAYIAAIGKVDAIVFTAGVGENSSLIRDLATRGLEHMGIAVDPLINERKSKERRDISTMDSTIKTLVIPTNEEYEIARQAYALVNEIA